MTLTSAQRLAAALDSTATVGGGRRFMTATSVMMPDRLQNTPPLVGLAKQRALRTKARARTPIAQHNTRITHHGEPHDAHGVCSPARGWGCTPHRAPRRPAAQRVSIEYPCAPPLPNVPRRGPVHSRMRGSACAWRCACAWLVVLQNVPRNSPLPRMFRGTALTRTSTPRPPRLFFATPAGPTAWP